MSIDSIETGTGVVYGMDDRTYHARPELSSTGARRILDSPARYKWEQTHRRESVAFDIGHAVHAKVLGAGPSIVPIPEEHLTPSGAVSTKAATAAWMSEQRAAGCVPVGPSDATRIDAMTEAVLAHKGARAILERDGQPEVSAFGTDPETGVACRARFDYLTDTHAADVKTTSGSASPAEFGRDAAKYGYPTQEAHYLATLAWAGGDDLPPMSFIVVEKSAPHLVAVHQFDELTRMVARELAATARRTYAECMASGVWPGYGDDVFTTQAPGWFLDLADDDAEMEFS